MTKYSDPNEIKCSFCGKTQQKVKRLIVCGRWLTSKYAAGDINADGKIDYVTYQAFYRIPYGAEDFDEYVFTNDTFLLIQGDSREIGRASCRERV